MGEMCVPLSVATTVSYTTSERIVRVEGSNTAGMFEAWRRRSFLLPAMDAASANEVSRVSPATGGRAKVSAPREFWIGKE